jgi:hypothetical protein
MKIVGITTDGVASMIGVRKGIVSRIQAVAAKGLIRVWCDAHQLDLAIKKALGHLSEAFLTTLTTMIAYLRRQQKLISKQESILYHGSMVFSLLGGILVRQASGKGQGVPS